MNKFSKNILCGVSCSVIVACGGGGGGNSGSDEVRGSGATGSSSSQSINTTAQSTNTSTSSQDATGLTVASSEESTQAQAAIAASKTSQLTADSDFMFSSHSVIPVNINTSADVEHVTICEVAANGGPNYQRCALRAVLDDGNYTGELLVTNDIQQLTLVSWDVDDPANPQISYWQRASDGDQISLN